MAIIKHKRTFNISPELNDIYSSLTISKSTAIKKAFEAMMQTPDKLGKALNARLTTPPKPNTLRITIATTPSMERHIADLTACTGISSELLIRLTMESYLSDLTAYKKVATNV